MFPHHRQTTEMLCMCLCVCIGVCCECHILYIEDSNVQQRTFPNMPHYRWQIFKFLSSEHVKDSIIVEVLRRTSVAPATKTLYLTC